MDGPETIIPDEDTTFALMLAAQKQGGRIDHCRIGDLISDRGQLYARVRKVVAQNDADLPLVFSPYERIGLADVDVVWIRKDPPFDAAYLWATLLLEQLRGKTLVLNDPRGLRDANEKLYALHFSEFMPDTLVTNHLQDIQEFQKAVDAECVIKPLDGRGGEGVLMLKRGDPNYKGIVETVTALGKRLAMVQRFIPEVKKGDKRILLWNGKPLGAILRVPQKDDFRSNIHVGGSVVAASLTPREQEMCEALGPRLRQDGLLFVGLDVINDHLTEINVTSPTGLQQMAKLDGKDLAAEIHTKITTLVS